MMFSQGNQASASPQSSYGVESIEGTPNTNLSALTPEDPRGKGKGKAVEQTVASSSTALNHDPFVTASVATNKDQKLSATASAFRPKIAATGSNAISSITIKIPSTPLPGTKEHIQQVIAQHATGAGYPNVTSYGTFSTDANIGRCFKVTDTSQTDAAMLCGTTLGSLAARGVDIGKNPKIYSTGQSAYLRLPNIRDAGLVFEMIKQDHPSFVVEYISAIEFGQIANPDATFSAHEGQVLLEATYPANMPLDKSVFEESLRAALAVEGELYAWQKFLATEAGTYRMVAEFVDSTHASRAVKRCNGKTVCNIEVRVCLHRPDVTFVQPTAVVATTPTRGATDQSNIGDIFGQMSMNNAHGSVMGGNGAVFGDVSSPRGMTYIGPPQTPMPVVMGYSSAGQQFQQYYSPITPMHQQQGDGGSLVNYNSSPYVHYGLSQHGMSSTQFARSLFSPGSTSEFTPQSSYGRRSFMSPSPTRRFGNGAGHHNHVDINRIQQGIDVRTTVMLRNIPNKVDQQMLKGIVDESSRGRYDFMYLRIDFSNNCNVGYAFINFVDPLDIIDFVIARSNQKWFKSDKVAEVSYATIQGRDCLIQKFRNSSVMLEAQHFRPKLFFTANDPFGRAGEEEEFPASDNASKLRRSCENAEHVGLFAPSAGQNMREEQRRRRSQFDRGTSLAEREEYGFDESEWVFPRSYAGPSRY